jgi:hypothetical protein
LVYEDQSNPGDEYDNVLFLLKNTFDQLVFAYSKSTSTSILNPFVPYNSIQVSIYSHTLRQWYVFVQLGFGQAIQLNEAAYDELIGVLASARNLILITNLNSTSKFLFLSKHFRFLFVSS